MSATLPIICPNCGHHIKPNATARQQKLLKAIRQHINDQGYAPTVPEIAAMLNLSKNAVIREIEQLVRDHRLTKRYRGPRSLAVIPEGAHP